MDVRIKDSFRQFIRNERWGSCADCPTDRDGFHYPEFCKETKRYDHHLTLQGLVELYNRTRGVR